MAFSWTCPYCQRNATITSNLVSSNEHNIVFNSRYVELTVRTFAILCPNPECNQYTLDAELYKSKYSNSGNVKTGENIDEWSLKPQSSAKSFPAYIPDVITKDYEEACFICNLSPKASATLSRRCLQGIIRDFWGVSKNRLVDEITAIQDKVDPSTWQAIDAIRKIGNIGAHMEKDINVIVDVDPKEAKLLIALIEVLLKDWYIARYERQQHLQAIINVAQVKEVAKKTAP